jgi:hypothetical protein
MHIYNNVTKSYHQNDKTGAPYDMVVLHISNFNSSIHVLEFGNVKVLNDCIELAFSSSKTDQTGVGTTIRLQGQSDKAIFPLVFINKLLICKTTIS